MNLNYSLNVDVIDLLKLLSKTRRLINSPGMDESLQLVNLYLDNNLIIHQYFFGEKAGDWIVPPSWELNFAQIKQGEKVIANSENSFLIAAAFKHIEVIDIHSYQRGLVFRKSKNSIYICCICGPLRIDRVFHNDVNIMNQIELGDCFHTPHEVLDQALIIENDI